MSFPTPSSKVNHQQWPPPNTSTSASTSRPTRSASLHLRKGVYSDPIRCDIFQAFQHEIEGVPYEALSYMWGSNVRANVISLDDCMTSVTRNLYEALWNLRLANRDRILWIDSLCIDQDNEKERSHQVGQMCDIYASAEGVIAWRGPATPETDLVIDFLNKTARDPSVLHAAAKLDESPTPSAPNKCSSAIGDTMERRWAGFQELTSQPWFHRIWVIQEVAMAWRAIIVCGQKAVSAGTLSMFPQYLNRPLERHVEAVLDVMPGPRRQKSWWSKERDLWALITKFSTNEATDPRDKVYALVGMSCDARDVVLPDYEKTEAEVWRDTISFLVAGEILDPSVYILPLWPIADLVDRLGDDPGQKKLLHSLFRWAVSQKHIETARRVVQHSRFPVNEEIKIPSPQPGPWYPIEGTPLMLAVAYTCSGELLSDPRSGAVGASLDGEMSCTMVECLLTDPDIKVDLTGKFCTSTALEIACATEQLLIASWLL